jgi:hypothetical protein
MIEKMQRFSLVFRFGLVTFSDSAFIEFPLGFSTDLNELKSAIINAQQDGGSTNLASALDLIVTDVLDDFQSLSRSAVVIYVTNDVSQDSKATLEASMAALRSTGATVISIGVGDQVSTEELHMLSSRVAYVESYSQLGNTTFGSQFVDWTCHRSVVCAGVNIVEATSISLSCLIQDSDYVAISAPAMTYAGGDIFISSNAQLVVIEFPVLAVIAGFLRIESNPVLQLAQAPVLRDVAGSLGAMMGSLYVRDNSMLTLLHAPSLSSVPGHLYVCHNAAEFTLPGISSGAHQGQVECFFQAGNGACSAISCP